MKNIGSAADSEYCSPVDLTGAKRAHIFSGLYFMSQLQPLLLVITDIKQLLKSVATA